MLVHLFPSVTVFFSSLLSTLVVFVVPGVTMRTKNFIIYLSANRNKLCRDAPDFS